MKFSLTEIDIFSIPFSQNGSNKVLIIPYFCFEIKVLKILKKLIFQGIQVMKFFLTETDILFSRNTSYEV